MRAALDSNNLIYAEEINQGAKARQARELIDHL